MHDKEINLLDFIVNVLLHWRMLIVWILVGGILMGCINYVQSYRMMQERASQENNKQIEEFEWNMLGITESSAQRNYLREQLTDMQASAVINVLSLESFAKEKEEYLNSSVRMNMNFLNFCQARLTFWISSDNEERSRAIEPIYEDMISIGLYQWIAENSFEDVSSANLAELISIDRSSSRLIYGGNSFSVLVAHETEEQCRILSQLVISYLEQQHSFLVQKIGTHDIDIVYEAYSSAADISLIDRRKSIENDIVALKTTAEDKKADFTNEEWLFYIFLAAEKSAGILEEDQKNSGNDSDKAKSELERQSSAGETSIASTPSISIKFILLGMFLSAFMYIFYLLIIFVTNTRLRANDEVAQIYGVPQLGRIPNISSQKKLLSFVDKWIDKLDNRNRRKFSEQESIDLAVAAIKLSVERDHLREIYCIGCNIQDKAEKVSHRIGSVLKKENIEMTTLSNILNDPQKMEKLQSEKSAFLLEKAGETFYDDIAKEMEFLEREKIRVLGIVVVE